jgi:hypothetical protein
MNHRDRIKLLFGPYQAPRLCKGDKASCLYRDRDVKVIGWTSARIPWPLCRAIGARGGWGLLVDEELARAIRQESAAAVAYWWGVNVGTVCRWRLAFGVDRVNNAGSHRLVLASAQKGAERLRGVPLSPKQREQRRRNAIEKGLGRNLRPGYRGDWWKPEDVALLGKLPDEEIAERTGRTALAVSLKRRKLGIPNPCDRRRRVCKG